MNLQMIRYERVLDSIMKSGLLIEVSDSSAKIHDYVTRRTQLTTWDVFKLFMLTSQRELLRKK